MIDNIEVTKDGAIEIEGETDAGGMHNAGYWEIIEPSKAEEIAVEVLSTIHPGKRLAIMQVLYPVPDDESPF